MLLPALKFERHNFRNRQIFLVAVVLLLLVLSISNFALCQSTVSAIGKSNDILYVDGTKYSTLAAGISACPSNGCLIYDTLPETFTADPLAGSNGKSIVVTFGAGVWTVNYTPPAGSGGIEVFATQRLIGTGRIFGASGGTIIRAGKSFSTGSNLVKLAGTQGTRVENLTLDCNGAAKSTGLYATDINENAGGYNLVIENCAAYGINVDASAFHSIPAQNYTFRDIEIFPHRAGSETTVGLRIKGNGGGGPAEIVNITANGASGHTILASVLCENWHQGTFRNIHGEFAMSVFESAAIAPISEFLLDTVTGSSTDTNIVNLEGASSNAFTLRNIASNGATHSLIDNARSITLKDSVLTSFSVGPGRIGAEDIYSTSPKVTKFLNGEITLAPTEFADLGTPANGTITFCSNCKSTDTCTSGGSGAIAKRLNGIWVCK